MESLPPFSLARFVNVYHMLKVKISIQLIQYPTASDIPMPSQIYHKATINDLQTCSQGAMNSSYEFIYCVRQKFPEYAD